MTEGVRYLEVKQHLLLSYCQAITFYLLLKSEGQPIRDHPVLARLVEIKSLLDKLMFVGLRNALRIQQPTQDGLVKGGVTSLCPGVHFIHYELKGVRLQFLIDWNSDRGGISFPNNMQLFNVCSTKQTKQLDGNLPSELEELLNSNKGVEMVAKLGRENATLSSDSFTKDQGSYPSAETRETTVPNDTAESEKVEPLKDNENKAGKCKHQSDQVGVQSMAMLKVRADLEERLKQEGILSSRAPKPDKAQKRLKPVNGRLVTYDDFDDDALDVGLTRFSKGHASSLSSRMILEKGGGSTSSECWLELESNLRMMLGMKLTILRLMGMLTWDVDMGDGDTGDSEDEYYKQVEQRRAAKLAAKAEMYSRISAVPPSSPETIDGKRHISYQMEKNRGLTRKRKKETKNPRKKYKEQHKKKVNRRKGQVQEIKKPTGPYGGEASGINVATSRSVRFKN
uniref:Sas10 C-terminal domain-containing protein n=1 Tax=Fagus sylvatica TaxID=28930 RepID=A0A2N9H7K8_FAGSY